MKKILGMFLFAAVALGVTGMKSEPAKAQDKMKKMAAAVVDYKVSDGPAIKAIEKSLTGKAGDANKGENTMANRKKGNCFACHLISPLAKKVKTNPKKYADMGDVGPPLDGLAGRYTVGEMRMLIVNAKAAFPDTIMPGFYRTKDFHRVKGKFKGKTVLKAQDIEDILAYLVTLKE